MRERYFENYKKISVPADNRRGFRTIYRYNTDWYGWSIAPDALRRTRVTFGILEALSLVVYFAAALQQTTFNTVRLTSGLAIVSIFCWILELWGVFRFASVKSPMTVSDFKEITNFIECGTVLRTIFLAAAVIAGFVICIRDGALAGRDIAVGIGHILSMICSFVIFLKFRKIGYDLYRNEDGQPGEKK